jgi:excisionase family DNA binding protein
MAADQMFFTVPEVGDLLRTTPKAIYTMVERGQLPGVTRIGKRVLVRRDLLLDFLAHKSAPSPEENRR